MGLSDTLKGIIKDAGETGLDELVDALEELKPKNKLQEVALLSLIDVLEDHGMDGINFASKEIVALIDGETFSDVSKLSPLARSDLLATMQLNESEIDGARRFVESVANSIGRFALAALKVVAN